MKLIGLAGKARCGKDTVADILGDEFVVVSYGFADPLKEAAAVLLHRSEQDIYGDFDFDREAILPEWGFSIRHFLQVLGTEGMRKLFGEEFWITRLGLELDTLKSDAVITDVRFENEAEFIRKRGGQIWHVYRPDPSGLNDQAQAHASEAGVAMLLGDRVIKNTGTLKELEAKVVELWTRLE